MSAPVTTERSCDRITVCPRCGSQNVKAEGSHHYVYLYHCVNCQRPFGVIR